MGLRAEMNDQRVAAADVDSFSLGALVEVPGKDPSLRPDLWYLFFKVEEDSSGDDPAAEGMDIPELEPVSADDVSGRPSVVRHSVEEFVPETVDVGDRAAVNLESYPVSAGYRAPRIQHVVLVPGGAGLGDGGRPHVRGEGDAFAGAHHLQRREPRFGRDEVQRALLVVRTPAASVGAAAEKFESFIFP
jgi:hypothetical protein